MWTLERYNSRQRRRSLKNKIPPSAEITGSSGHRVRPDSPASVSQDNDNKQRRPPPPATEDASVPARRRRGVAQGRAGAHVVARRA